MPCNLLSFVLSSSTSIRATCFTYCIPHYLYLVFRTITAYSMEFSIVFLVLVILTKFYIAVDRHYIVNIYRFLYINSFNGMSSLLSTEFVSISKKNGNHIEKKNVWYLSQYASSVLTTYTVHWLSLHCLIKYVQVSANYNESLLAIYSLNVENIAFKL